MNKLIHQGILVTALLVGTSIPLHAQYAQPGMPQQGSQGYQGYQGTNEWQGQRRGHHGMHGQWKAQREEIANEIKAQDAELQQLATQMTNAPSAQKLDAVAAVVGKLVEDRLTLHQKLEEMHQQMHGTNMDTNTNGYDTNVGGALPESR
jgi:hypothetical protein